uniref:EXOSC1 domain-containing protein n=1 Tax=Macrostomum lignano TaxID=282301 RepID=A0A1I8FN92_9PLAT
PGHARTIYKLDSLQPAWQSSKWNEMERLLQRTVSKHETETAPGKVVRVTNRVAHCTLLACNRVKLHPGFKAQIRREDVRATERDRVELADCFRAGDIVQARNELGVVVASGQHGSKLVPVSWNEMRCPITGQVYKRKVANVPEEFVK